MIPVIGSEFNIARSSILRTNLKNKFEDREMQMCKMNVLNNEINVIKDTNYAILGYGFTFC